MNVRDDKPSTQTTAWGVMLGKTEFAVRKNDAGHGLAGIYLQSREAPALALRTALFSTRREARALAIKVKDTWPKARPVKLSINVSVQDE